MERVYRLDEIQTLAREFWESYPEKKVYALHGPMGAGKTTLVHALCEAKGVIDRVASPTFSIINEYVYPGGKIYHIDLYRLNGEDEAIRAGVEDCFYSGATCFVEWPDKAAALLPSDTISISLETAGEKTRRISINPST